MAAFSNLMEVFKLLEKSNCRKCDEKTCLAFAASVFGGKRPITDCPQLAPEIAARFDSQPRQQDRIAQEADDQLAELKAQLARIDFTDAAARIGAAHSAGKLVFKVMGKEVGVDCAGNVYTDIHVNPWVMGPIFTYILSCKGTPLTDQWVPLRELPSGGDWYRLFGQRCEKPMKKVADAYPDLFSDLVDLFDGRPAGNQFQSDVAVVLRPLPRVPLLICYWYAEEGMASALNLFFDATVEDNLGIEGLYALGAGITRMFEKLALRHGAILS